MTLVDPSLQPRQSRLAHRSVTVTPVELGLFGLFSLYGPSFSFVGQLRIIEAALLAWVILRIGALVRSLRGLELTVFTLIILAGIMQIVSGIYNDSPSQAIFARAGTYFLMGFVFFAAVDLCKHEPRRLLAIVFGYCLSYVFIMVVGTATSAGYATHPWRLGLGFAVMTGVAAYFAAQPRHQVFAPLAFLLLAAVNLANSSRFLAGLCLLVAGASLISQLRRSRKPVVFSLLVVSSGVALAAGAMFLGIQALVYLSQAGLLPAETAQKMLTQAQHSAGFLAAARPDTMTAIYAVQQRPLIGYGPGVVDPEILILYLYLSAEGLVGVEGAENYAIWSLDKEWELGTPNHSHLFGAWADAGIASALVWVAVLLLAGFVMVRSFLFRNSWGPLYLLIATATIWDVLFSPGPHRMDMAIRLLILLFAVQHFRMADQR